MRNRKYQNRNKQVEKKVLKEKALRLKKGFIYEENPRVSFILQFFNKRRNIKQIIENLRLAGDGEIIVIDDGSSDGSYEDWVKYLDRSNDFFLRCNDLFEVRTYNRAIRMARGRYICLLQDDDIPAPNDSMSSPYLKHYLNYLY